MRVLHVDGDSGETRRVARVLEGESGIADVVTETDPEEALSRLATGDVDCLVSGYDLPGMDGIEFVRTVREAHGDVPVVLFTGSGSEAVASRAISAGVTDYVRKGPEGGGLDALVERIGALADDGETTPDGRYDEAQFERFVAAFPDVVFVIDEDGRSVDLVAGGNNSLLYEQPEELIGRRFHDVYPAETADRFLDTVRRALDAGERQRIEYQLDVQAGRRWFEARVGPLDTGGEKRTVFWIARDITERKRRQQEYEQIFDGVNDSIVIQDPETAEPIDANEAFLDRLGYDDVAEIREAGLEGLSAAESGYTTERARELCHRVMETGEPEVVEWQQETKDGEGRWIEATIDAAVIRGEDRILSIQRDITGRKRRERAIESLQAATERLQRAETANQVASVAVETASDVLDLPMAVCWFHDAESDRLDPVAATDVTREAGLVSGLASDRYEYAVFEEGAVTEYTPAEHDPDNPLDAGVLLPLGEHGLIAAGRRNETERLADESVLDIAGALAEHATTALDRVERGGELRESERRFRLIAERIDEVIYLATPDFSEVLYVNPAYESIWGRPVEELYDDARKFLAAVDPRDKEDTEAGVQAMVEEMQQGDPADSYEFEYRIRQPDGEIRWVNATGYAVEMAGGEQRFVGIVEDITERKQREQRLEVFNRILRHNLRNQLDVIRSHAETLADRTEEDHAERIIAAVDELAAMGARARKTDRIMSMDTEVTDVSLPETLREAVETVAPGHGTVDVTTDLPQSAELATNGEALYTGVKSALENAVTYADSKVTVTVEERTDGYTVVIEDDGPGIPREELVPIEAGTETNLRHGRGLGLWQLRWGVDKLNGELSFDTDGGTTIRITVPDCAESGD